MNEADLLLGASAVVGLTVLLALWSPIPTSADAPSAAPGPCTTEPAHG